MYVEKTLLFHDYQILNFIRNCFILKRWIHVELTGVVVNMSAKISTEDRLVDVISDTDLIRTCAHVTVCLFPHNLIV